MKVEWYDRAKLALKARNVRYVDLMSALGVETAGAVGHYLNGRREPTVKQLKAIAKAAGLSLDEMTGSDPRFVNDDIEKRAIDALRNIASEEERIMALKFLESLSNSP